MKLARLLSVWWLCLVTSQVNAGTLILGSQHVPWATPAPGASGDSVGPVLSGDGRYVLFASEAEDLPMSNSVPRGNALANFNVYLRDRVTGQSTLVSINASTNGAGNGDSIPLGLSEDNRFALFESFASNLVNGDTNGTGDIFLRDLTLGTTRLVSVNTNGLPGNGRSRSATMTPDGRYVAFVSAASDLVPGDTNHMTDVFLRDMQSGTTVCASPGGAAVNVGSTCEDPILSSDGRYVEFFSTAVNLAPPAGGLNGNVPGDVYVRDVTGGQTICVSTNARVITFSSGTLACLNHAMSSDGQWAAFACGSNVFRFNVQTRVTTIASTNGAIKEAFAEAARSLDMTPDGRFIVFVGNHGTNVLRWDGQSNSTASNSVPTTCYELQVDAAGRYITFSANWTNAAAFNGATPLPSACNWYRWDVQAGTTILLNKDASGTPFPFGAMSTASVSTNAQIVAFDARDTGLVPNDNNHAYDVIVRDVLAGTNQLISIHEPALLSVSANTFSSLTTLSISSNGQFIAFGSAADNLVANDSNPLGFSRVFFRDLAAGTNLLASSGVSGMAFEPALSANGRYVAFTARATNIYDVYRYDTQSGATALVSVNTNGVGHTVSTGAANSPSISADGRFVLFQSTAQDLTPGIPAGTNHYLRDFQTGTTRALTTNSSKTSVASMTADGHYIALGFSSGVPGLWVFDTQAGAFVYSNSASGILAVSISANGNRLAYVSNSTLWLIDRVANTNGMIAAFFSARRPGLKFSADGHALAYATKPSSSATNTDVWVYEFFSSLVSRSYLTGLSAGGTSDSPDMTADGRYIAYRSDSAVIIPGDTNGVPDIFLFDRMVNTTRLVSTNISGNTFGDGRSLAPLFSADSQSLLFGSWAGNLIASDYNQGGDVFLMGLSSASIADSDGDGMDDAWELHYFGSLARDGTGDFDGDGVSDLNEFLAGTDPTDPTSYLRLTVMPGSVPTAMVELSWPAAPNKSYRVEYKTELTDSTWTSLGQGVVILEGHGYQNDPNPDGNQRFYRVSVVP